MPDAAVAERILMLVTTPDRASSTVGDLLEESGERGSVWFWSNLLRTACSHLWQGFWTSKGRMGWLAVSGLLELWVLSMALGWAVISVWMDFWPYQIDPNSTYIPLWGFYALRVALVTAVPLVAGWDVASRSHGRELAGGFALASAIFAGRAAVVLSSGTVVRHTESLILSAVMAVGTMAGAILCRYRAIGSGRTTARDIPPYRSSWLFLLVLVWATTLVECFTRFEGYPSSFGRE